MYRLRPCHPNDLPELLALSAQTGAGMTSMPYNPEFWEARIKAVQQSFSSAPPKEGQYFLVLESTKHKGLLGTTAVYTGVAQDQPFYVFKLTHDHRAFDGLEGLELSQQHTYLERVAEYQGASEIGSLFLHPSYRQPGIGLFMSRARFLMMADAPERFGSRIFAELRGWLTPEGRSPMWDALGHKLLNISFDQAVHYTAQSGMSFMDEMLPHHPICLDLLPEAAKAVVGKPHDASAPALSMLLKEGFESTGLVDLFDAGPHVECAPSKIRTVQESRVHKLIVGPDQHTSECDDLFMISNGIIENLTIGLVPAKVTAPNCVRISQESADYLNLSEGQSVRVAPLKRPKALAGAA